MERPLTAHIDRAKPPLDLKAYEQAGGYRAVRTALGQMTPEEVITAVKASNLRGRGGAGFPTGQKWSFVPMGEGVIRPKYLVVNADEMEPATFKDRLLLEGNPHQLIEGIIISAYAVQADIAYIFLRHAYTLAAKRLEKAITEAYAAGFLGPNILGANYGLELYLHQSVGRYICGEETAMLNSLEGRRAIPRAKPPFPPVIGLWGKPTAFNNVETISNISHIINHGAHWFKGLSRSEDSGTKIYGVSGRVKKPGAWELPMGTSIREILEKYASGMCNGYNLRALMPGGASTEFLAQAQLDVKMDFDSVKKAGSRLGTGNMIVLDDRTCPVGLVLNLMQFFAHESCGWCTPCREGLPWIVQILKAIEEGRGKPEDIQHLRFHTRTITLGHTFCALAPGAMEPLQSALNLFEEDFQRHLHSNGCPWR